MERQPERIAGVELAREGEALLKALYPTVAERHSVATRLSRRARKLIDNPQTMDVGFFVFGMAQAAAGRKIGGGR